MNEGLFRTQINTSWEILKKLNLGNDMVRFPNYPRKSASYFRNLTYIETWEKCIKNQHYDFQTTDNSLLQFSADFSESLVLRYAYYECPYQARTYVDFVIDNGFNPNEIGDEFRTDYEEYLSTINRKESFTPIRYDYAPSQYREGSHPASHIHLGHNNDVRIGTKKILKPLSFLLFVIRQFYPSKWHELLEMEQATTWCRNIRENLDEIDETQFWKQKDLNELHLY